MFNPKLYFVFILILFLSSCSTSLKRGYFDSGTASWYGEAFHGRKTASGEIYDMHAMTAAHPSLPFGTVIKVQSKATGKSVEVRINDRGPFSGGRILDLSYAAARKLGIIRMGEAVVEIFVTKIRTEP